ncbi:MAG: T9SS type A sorting domain-containing protein [Chitinophagaceae bacterium]
MKKLIYSVLLLLFGISSQAQSLIMDSTFATNGFHKNLVPNTTSGILDVQVAPNQKIYALCIKETGVDMAESFVAKFNADGTLDNTYGSNGISAAIALTNEYTTMYKMAIQTDGKIVVIGESYNYITQGNPTALAARLTSSGALDNTFGTGGKAIILTNWNMLVKTPESLSIQPDGKILIAIESLSDSSIFTRLNTDGSADMSFGTNSVVQPESKQGLFFNQIKVLSDGSIIGGGYRNIGGIVDTTYLVLYKFSSNGTLDNTFGQNGIATFDIPNYSEFSGYMDIQTDGKIIYGGSSYASNGSTLSAPLLVRFNANGSLDASYNSGQGYVNFSIPNTESYIEDFKIDANNKVTAITSNSDINGNPSIIFLRFNSNGTADNTFNGTSNYRILDEIPFAESYAMDLQNDGKLVFGGIETDATFTAISTLLGRLKSSVNVGVQDFSITDKTKVYPTILYPNEIIKLENASWVEHVSIMNTQGQMVLAKMSNQTVQLPNHLSSGKYQLVLTGNSNTKTISILVK